MTRSLAQYSSTWMGSSWTLSPCGGKPKSGFAKYGIALTDDMCRGTKGKRLDAVVAHWLEYFERPELDGDAIEEDVVQAMETLLLTEVEALPGVVETLASAVGSTVRGISRHRPICVSRGLRSRDWVSGTRFLTESSPAIRWLSQNLHRRSSSRRQRGSMSRLRLSGHRRLNPWLRCREARRSTVLVVPEVGVSTEGSLGRRITSERALSQTLLNRYGGSLSACVMGRHWAW